MSMHEKLETFKEKHIENVDGIVKLYLLHLLDEYVTKSVESCPRKSSKVLKV